MCVCMCVCVYVCACVCVCVCVCVCDSTIGSRGCVVLYGGYVARWSTHME